LLPEYSLLSNAGSRLGPSDPPPLLAFGKGGESKMSEESKQKCLVSQPTSIKIEVLDLETNITTTYISVRAAAKAIRCPNTTVLGACAACIAPHPQKIQIRES
jgi:hypothetical protein